MKISLKKTILLLIAVIILGLLFYFLKNGKNQSSQDNSKTQSTSITQSAYATVVSTDPSNLQNGIILPNQTVQITFTDPILNTDELKHTMDPEGGYDLKLSFDRKTLLIVPNPSFKLGTGYTFTIKSDYTKFDKGKKLQSDIIYHFNTIEYKGV